MNLDFSKNARPKLAALLCATVYGSMMGAVSMAEGDMGRVTLMVGAPRMVGEAIRPLQSILSGHLLETGEDDALGLLVENIVFHLGINSKVRVIEEPDGKRVVIESGYVVFYADEGTRSKIAMETPFGRLTWLPDVHGGDTGWYSVRHEPQGANASPAVSTFAAMEGASTVEGTAPVAGPYDLLAGHRWRIVQGQIPGPPEVGDDSDAADQLRELLHRQTAEIVRIQGSDVTRLSALNTGFGPRQATPQIIAPTNQLIIEQNAVVQDRIPTNPPLVNPIPDVVIEPEPMDFVFADPIVITAGAPNSAIAQFVGYAGVPANPDFNDFLTAVDGNPAFQPAYLTDFANGGFSYLQLAGPNAELVDNNGATFLAEQVDNASGWAFYSPLQAVADSGFDAGSSYLAVVSDGFGAIARGDHLSGGGTIGAGGDSGSAFATISGDNVELNPNQPVGYPQLSLASDTGGLTVGGEAVSDQIAAIGAGLNPLQLSQTGPQLLFLSNSDQDALGNRFNFDGDAITPTALNLPSDRTVALDDSGFASVGTPLTNSPDNTVGIQFSAAGQTIAVIHHGGGGNLEESTLPASEQFEVIRGSNFSLVQWRDGGRITGADGEVVQFEDLNDMPDVRNELFTVLCDEVNHLVPPDQHTICGPALSQPGSGVLRTLRRTPGRFVLSGDRFSRRAKSIQRTIRPQAGSSSRVRSLRSGGGRLVKTINSPPAHRYIGRATVTR